MQTFNWDHGQEWLQAAASFWFSWWGLLVVSTLVLGYLAAGNWRVHRRRGWAYQLFRSFRWVGRGLLALLVGLFLEVSQDDLGNWDDD